jgi:hypothetical protein
LVKHLDVQYWVMRNWKRWHQSRWSQYLFATIFPNIGSIVSLTILISTGLLILEECYQVQCCAKHYYTNNVRWHIGHHNIDKCWLNKSFNNINRFNFTKYWSNILMYFIGWCDIEKYYTIHNEVNICWSIHLPILFQFCVWQNIHFHKIF